MKKLLLLLSAVCLLCEVAAQQTEQTPEPDSILTAYYNRCRDHLRQPEILAMCDTLRRMSIERSDLNMEGTAMVFTVDYYSSQNNLDSLQSWMQRIREFSLQHNIPKPYYFSWHKLIGYYVKKAQYTLAQYEIEKMIKQAEQDDYKFGVAQAYQNMGNIYLLRGMPAPAAEYYQKAVDYILNNKLDEYTLNAIYSQLAKSLSSTYQYKEALKALDQSEKYISIPEVKYLIDGIRAGVYAKMGETKQALDLLRKVEQNKPAFFPDAQLYELRMQVYEGNRMYPEALESINALIETSKNAGEPASYYSELIEARARMHAAMGNTQQAYEDMELFSKHFKEKVSREGESTLAEFATLMGVEQLNREKVELQQKAQEERLQRNRTIITGLGLILLLAIGFIAAQLRSKRSLARAKRAAEEADRMKGEFIRHITHEVNTPLNSVLGFSQLAIAVPADDPERQGYIDILNENSDYLQKLIDDILYVSDLEAADTEPARTPTDLVECCRHAMNNITHLRKEGVELIFTPGSEKLPAATSVQFVIKVTSELLRNSLTFTKEGRIELSAWLSDDGTATISITDTGCGVPTAEAEHIFERFVKLNSFSHGMGIGLSVCRMIAHAMGGKVQLDTTHSTRGARFLFTFPTA